MSNDELVERIAKYLGWYKTIGPYPDAILNGNGENVWSERTSEATRNGHRSRAREVIAICKPSPTRLQAIWDAAALLDSLDASCPWTANGLRAVAAKVQDETRTRDELRKLVSDSNVVGTETTIDAMLERFTVARKGPVTT